MPWAALYSAAVRPVCALMSSSLSRITRPSTVAMLRPTVVLPEPISPTSAMCWSTVTSMVCPPGGRLTP